MSKFEAVVLLSPDLSSSNIKKQEDLFEKQVNELAGSIISREDWGLRYLSYKIKSFMKAFYKFYQIEIEGMKIQNIKLALNLNEKILRHLLIKVEKHEELPTKLSKSY